MGNQKDRDTEATLHRKNMRAESDKMTPNGQSSFANRKSGAGIWYRGELNSECDRALLGNDAGGPLLWLAAPRSQEAVFWNLMAAAVPILLPPAATAVA